MNYQPEASDVRNEGHGKVEEDSRGCESRKESEEERGIGVMRDTVDKLEINKTMKDLLSYPPTVDSQRLSTFCEMLFIMNR